MKATKVTMQFVLVTLLYFLAFAQAQDDPQDIADTACLYSGATYEFNSVEGYIESPNYPNEYASSEECRWYINPSGGIPSGQGMYLEIIDFSTESCCDEIWVRVGDGVWGQLLYELAGSYSPGQFFFLGSEPVTLQFTSDGSVTYPGFNVRFYMGDKSPGQILADIACDDETLPLTLYNETNILETPDYPVADHPYGTQCQWILLPQNNNNGIYLSVLYFYAYNYLYIYFGDDPTGDDYETYWYGSYSPGHGIYSPGNAMSLRYEGYYNYDGFQLVYFQADPACTSGSASVIAVNEKAELKSPGYPYVLSEHLSCRWLLEAPEGQKITLTSLDLDLYGNGVDCTDEYVEVLDGDTVDALSLGKFCGNVTFGTIPSTSNALQVYLRTHEEAIFQTHTGFRFEHETQ